MDTAPAALRAKMRTTAVTIQVIMIAAVVLLFLKETSGGRNVNMWHPWNHPTPGIPILFISILVCIVISLTYKGSMLGATSFLS